MSKLELLGGLFGAIMSDAYANVVGGGLKLKGITKKKKKKGGGGDDAVEQAAAMAAASAAAASSEQQLAGSGHTATELRRRETMLQRQFEKIEKGEDKSHRDKVKDFNGYLSNLTEHYDLPKVSKGN